MGKGALDGITVLDFSTLLPGPMATLLLAEAGAQVIKVERPGRGDALRDHVAKWGKDSASFNILNRGKKSVVVDLKNESDRIRLQPLIKNADIVVEQFRPGVMARLGLGFDDVIALNRRIIYCSISGYGQDGPKRDVAGHDLNYIGDAGLLALSLGTEKTPVIPPALIADIAGGSYPAVFNILLALRERERTGRGSHIDIAMAESAWLFAYWALADGQATHEWSGNGDALLTGGSPRYRLFPTADGRFVAVAALEQKFWDAFVGTIGLDKTLRDDNATPLETTRAIAAIIRTRPSDQWRAIFSCVDCCCSVVQSIHEAMADRHFVERGIFDRQVVNELGATMTALPVPIAKPFRCENTGAVASPRLGEHNCKFLDRPDASSNNTEKPS